MTPRVGAVAPEFELPDLHGRRASLRQWRGRCLVLLFLDPAAPGCRAIAPDLAFMCGSPGLDRPVPIIVSTGHPDENRAFLSEFGIRLRLFLQEDCEVATLYGFDWTPSACQISSSGLIVSRAAVGGEAVVQLAVDPLWTPRRPRDTARQISRARDLSPRRPTRFSIHPGGLPAGGRAPDFVVPRLGGGRLSLRELSGSRILLVFVDPVCGACHSLGRSLRRARSMTRDLRVVLVSRGTAEANSALTGGRPGSPPVGLQRHWEVSRSYGLLATPVAYLIDEHGTVVESAAIGASEVLRLAAAAGCARPGRGAGRGHRDEEPLVSVIVPTCDRPGLLTVALRCFAHQTYRNRELIVVDDGRRWPVDERSVLGVGGRLVRLPPGTPLGTKLNEGALLARGRLCQRADDDDWYGPDFLDVMVDAWTDSRETVCRPTLTIAAPVVSFDLSRWELRLAPGEGYGGTFMFAREDWAARPFRALTGPEDTWFVLDQLRSGVSLLKVDVQESYLLVRHDGAGRGRGHTWNGADAAAAGRALGERPVHAGAADNVLPPWALRTYRGLRRRIHAVAGPAAPSALR